MGKLKILFFVILIAIIGCSQKNVENLKDAQVKDIQRTVERTNLSALADNLSKDNKILDIGKCPNYNKPKSYYNKDYRFMVYYPENWFPSPDNYGNAFEIINYDPNVNVPSRKEFAYVIIVFSANTENPEKQFEDMINLYKNYKNFQIKRYLIDGRQAAFMFYHYPPERSGLPHPPFMQPVFNNHTKTNEDINDDVNEFSLVINNGISLIRLTGTRSADAANSSTDCEVQEIIKSISFDDIKNINETCERPVDEDGKPLYEIVAGRFIKIETDSGGTKYVVLKPFNSAGLQSEIVSLDILKKLESVKEDTFIMLFEYFSHADSGIKTYSSCVEIYPQK